MHRLPQKKQEMSSIRWENATDLKDLKCGGVNTRN
ncbi:hypothetical protein QFZ84_001389 [Pseudomonas fluorescens]